MNAHLGGIGVSDSLGKCSPIYLVLVPKSGTNAQYVAYALRHAAHVGAVKSYVNTIRFNSSDFKRDALKLFRLPMPEPGEQGAIVRFLDHANQRIERFIRTKRKLIALLNEQKQAIIHRAVTRGLDPGVPMKDSGLTWLGEMPAHWKLQALKQTLGKMDYGTSESARSEGRIRVLTMGHVRDGRVCLPAAGALSSVPQGLLLENGDLLFNRTNSLELVGKVGLFLGHASDEVTFASYLVRLRVLPEHSPQWLNLLLNSVRFWAYARSHSLVSLHQANLNSSRYARMLLPVPPRSEQLDIVAHVRTTTEGIELAASRAEQQVSLIREYRTRLISDVVTGQLDVRQAAAQLPQLPDEEPPPPDDAEPDLDEDDDTEAGEAA